MISNINPTQSEAVGKGVEAWKVLVGVVRSIVDINPFPATPGIQWDMSGWELERLQYAWLGACLRAMVDGLSGFLPPHGEVTAEKQYYGALQFVLKVFVELDDVFPDHVAKMKVSFGHIEYVAFLYEISSKERSESDRVVRMTSAIGMDYRLSYDNGICGSAFGPGRASYERYFSFESKYFSPSLLKTGSCHIA